MDTTHIVHCIADYGAGDPAWAEVEDALVEACGINIRVLKTAVVPRSTLNHGFWLHQHGLKPIALQRIFYGNTAPRLNAEGNKGDPLVYFKLKSGVHGLEVNAGWNLSFLAPHLETLCPVIYPHSGTPFRSRDDFPGVLRRLLSGQLFSAIYRDDVPTLGEPLNHVDPAIVRPLPQWPSVKVAHVDPYGNCKLTVRASQLPFEAGSELHVSVLRNGRPVSGESLLADRRLGDFDRAQRGILSVVNGSSGFNDPFVELFVYDPHPGTLGAADLLGGVQVEDDVVIEPV